MDHSPSLSDLQCFSMVDIHFLQFSCCWDRDVSQGLVCFMWPKAELWIADLYTSSMTLFNILLPEFYLMLALLCLYPDWITFPRTLFFFLSFSHCFVRLSAPIQFPLLNFHLNPFSIIFHGLLVAIFYFEFFDLKCCMSFSISYYY